MIQNASKQWKQPTTCRGVNDADTSETCMQSEGDGERQTIRNIERSYNHKTYEGDRTRGRDIKASPWAADQQATQPSTPNDPELLP